MAQGQKETILEKDQRETLLLSAPPLWLTPPGSLSGQSSHEAVGSRRPRKGRISQQLQLDLPCPAKSMLLFILWAVCEHSLQDPLQNNNKNPIEAPFSLDHVFPEPFLEIKGCIAHTRPQEAREPCPPYSSWEVIQKCDHRAGHTAGLSPTGSWPSSLSRQLIAIWLHCTDLLLPPRGPPNSPCLGWTHLK